MTKYLEDKRASLVLMLVCFATYTIVGFTRNAYAAAIAGIIEEGYFTKLDAGTIAASFNITYCISQIIGSYFVDKISPFKIILLGVIITIIANIVMSINSSYWSIFISRAVCGIAQFGIWPSLLRIVAEYTNESYRRRWMYIMPLGITSGSIISYLAAALVSNWRGMFVLSYVLLGACMIAFVIVVIYSNKMAVEKAPAEKKVSKQSAKGAETNSTNLFKLMAASGTLFLIIPTIAKSLIASGISSWMPTMIMESYNVSSGISSTLTAISTCANLAAVFWVAILYPRVLKTQPTAVGMFFLFSVPLLLVLCFIGKIPLILVVVLITIVNTFKNAIHQFFTVEIPSVYTKYNKAGMVAGILNAFATFSGIIASVFYGYMAENFGWNVTVASWLAFAIVGMLLSFAATPLWKKFWKN